MLNTLMISLATLASAAAPLAPVNDKPAAKVEAARMASAARPNTPLRGGTACNANKKVKTINVAEDLKIYVTMQDGNRYVPYDDRYFGTNSGNAIYNLVVTGFLSGANVDLLASGGDCSYFDNVQITAP